METGSESAIKSVSGPCVILAGAGTGKTYAIIEKLRHLIVSGIAPERIVCLTFSNEAVNSLRERAMKIIEGDKEPVIRTFHSFCSDLLQEHGDKINLKDFKILLPDDAKIMLHKNLKIHARLCSEYVGTIGIAKDLGINVEDLENYVLRKNMKELIDLENELKELQFNLQIIHLDYGNKDKDYKSKLKEKIDALSAQVRTRKLLQVWKNYEKIKLKKGLLDYSDLNVYALRLLKQFPEIADYRYIIVDEFQDTNKLQVELLAKLGKDITVVGDLNQSIYRFRGAYKDNLALFRRLFGVRDRDIYALDKSYRSSNKILRVAHKLIENNYQNKEECFPVYSAYNTEGEKVEVYELKNPQEECRKIIELIKEEIAKGTDAEKICVMFRTHQQSRMLKSFLDMERIDYVSVTKKSLLKTSSVKRAIEYLTILQAIKNKSKGYDKTWWELVHSLDLGEEEIVVSDYIKKNREQELSIKMLSIFDELKLSEVSQVKLKILLEGLKKLQDKIDLPIVELVAEIYRIAGLYPDSEDSLEKEKILILERFISMVKEFAESDSPMLGDFLYHLQVIESLGIEIEAPSLESKGVRLMTNHATKGLEYEVVIVSSLAQKRFPLERYSSSLIPVELLPELAEILVGSDEEKEQIAKQYEVQASLLEERRLCYVAFTRARRRLILTYAQQYGSRADLPSQFLGEIDYMNNEDIAFSRDLEEKNREITSAFEMEKKVEKGKHLFPIEMKLSPSALNTFAECQKRYEYKYIYNMPESYPDEAQRRAMKLGSFVHVVFDKGVKAGYKTEKDFIDQAKILIADEDWNLVDIEEAIPLIKVFFARNKDKYSDKSVTEQKLYYDFDGVKFVGVADRIDFHPDGVEIVDYKTGASDISPRNRNWQLGLYALAAAKKYDNVKRVTLDMLKKERPLEFDLDDEGNAVERNSHRMSFNVLEIREELVKVAKEVIDCYEKGFKPCASEKNCEFCTEMGFS